MRTQMSDNKMYLDDIQMPNLLIPSAASKDKLRFSIWGGYIRFGIVKEGEYKAFFEKTLSGAKFVIFKHALNKMIKANPESKEVLVYQKWDQEQKKYITDYVVKIIKDAKQVYSIAISVNGGDGEYVFNLKGPGGIAFGSNPMTESEKSHFAMMELMDWLTNTAPVATILSSRKKTFDKNKGSGSAPASSNKPSSDNDEDYY